jgi:hypothetical protein
VNRRGVALFVAVLALGVLGAVTATLLGLTLTESALGRSSLSVAQAEALAEGAASEAWRGWSAGLTPLAPGDSLEVARFVGASGEGKAVVRGLGGTLFALEASAPLANIAGRPPGRVGVLLIVSLDSLPGDSLVVPHLVARGWRLIPR